jgi:hypothetical protein
MTKQIILERIKEIIFCEHSEPIVPFEMFFVNFEGLLGFLQSSTKPFC